MRYRIRQQPRHVSKDKLKVENEPLYLQLKTEGILL